MNLISLITTGLISYINVLIENPTTVEEHSIEK